jgi:Domain of unknown function (DUF892)
LADRGLKGPRHDFQVFGTKGRARSQKPSNWHGAPPPGSQQDGRYFVPPRHVPWSFAVEHYEIARYGTLIAWAEELGHDDVVRLLTTNLNEGKAADKNLSNIALRKGVNRRAAS